MSELRQRTAAAEEKEEKGIDEEEKTKTKPDDLPTYAEMMKFAGVGLSFGLAILAVMHGTRFIGMWLDGKFI
ncbi:hypothetical protein COCOBI_13-1570 [Coccomyxa sp. Obi]|nr:hypothetical protein COCOBI_13-1570 [Coccomyxa sp. Obi]